MGKAPRTRIRLCGRFEFEIDGDDLTDRLPSGQARSVLAYLLANRDHAPGRGELIDVLWPENPPKDPHADLRPVLSRVRRALAPAALEGRDRLRVVLPEPVSVDVEEAASAIEAARAAAEGGDWARAREAATRGRGLLAGGFLPGHEADWIEARRRALDELDLEALEWAARCGLALGGAGLRDAERAANELIERSPYREAGYRLRMEALAADGNPAEALRVYEQVRTMLRDELGTAPAPDLQALHAELLAGEARGAGARAPASAPPAQARIPLPALLSPRERGAFIGREAEVETMRAAWARARAGQREIVLLAGDPGIGKTRLTGEFAVQAHTEGTVLYAACPQEAVLPYQPIVEALRYYARIQPLGDALGDLGPGAPELALLVPELGAPPASTPAGPPLADPETRRYMMFDAVAALVSTASERSPILLVLDDLHWADPPTLRLVGHLLASQRQAALLIIGTYRASEVTTGDPLAELIAELRRTERFDRIRLRGLSRDDVVDLITFYAGAAAPETLLQAIYDGTDGNPFFVEEVVRHLIESGALFEREGRWIPSLTVEGIGVPEEVEEVILSRLGRLSEVTGTVLRNAAVLGRDFSFDVLQSMTGLDDDALIATLDEALAAQLIVEEARQRGGPGYAFTHALVRETLYRGITAARVQRMHAEAAMAIEAAEGATGDAQVASLAFHLRRAGQAGDPGKGVEYSLRAGTRAREVFAWDDAALHLEGAVDLLEQSDEQPEARAQLLVGLADLMIIGGEIGRQIEYLERALEIWTELGAADRAARVHSRLGMAHSLMDSIYAPFLDLRRAFRHFDAARAVLDHEPRRAARGHLLTAIATAQTNGLRVEQGLANAAEAIEIANMLGDPLLWLGAAEVYAWHQIAAGNLREGFEVTEQAFERSQQNHRPFLAWLACQQSGQLTWGLCDPDRAQEHFERAASLPYIERTAYRQMLADAIGRCHASRGEFGAARQLLADAKPVWFTHSLKPVVDLWDGKWADVEALAGDVLEISRRTENRWNEWSAHHFRGRVLALRGEHEAALASLESALAIVVDGRAPYWALWVRPDLIRTLAELGRLDDAAAQVERSREVVGNGEDWRGRAGHVELADAVLLSRRDRVDEAGAAFTRALEIFRRYRLRCEEAEGMYEWGAALARAGDLSGAEEKLDAALDLYRRHEAGEPYRERALRKRQRVSGAPG